MVTHDHRYGRISALSSSSGSRNNISGSFNTNVSKTVNVLPTSEKAKEIKGFISNVRAREETSSSEEQEPSVFDKTQNEFNLILKYESEYQNPDSMQMIKQIMYNSLFENHRKVKQLNSELKHYQFLMKQKKKFLLIYSKISKISIDGQVS